MHLLKFAVCMFLVMRMRTGTTDLACLPCIAECQKEPVADGKASTATAHR